MRAGRQVLGRIVDAYTPRAWLLILLASLAPPLAFGLAQHTASRAAMISPGFVAEITTDTGQRLTLHLELAQTPEQRARGLMHRQTLADDSGMLFVYGADVSHPFWMADTPLPLSIAFIDARGVIVDIRDLQPLDVTRIYPRAPYRFALEVNQGLFAAHSIAPHDRVRFRS